MLDKTKQPIAYWEKGSIVSPEELGSTMICPPEEFNAPCFAYDYWTGLEIAKGYPDFNANLKKITEFELIQFLKSKKYTFKAASSEEWITPINVYSEEDIAKYQITEEEAENLFPIKKSESISQLELEELVPIHSNSYEGIMESIVSEFSKGDVRSKLAKGGYSDIYMNLKNIYNRRIDEIDEEYNVVKNRANENYNRSLQEYEEKVKAAEDRRDKKINDADKIFEQNVGNLSSGLKTDFRVKVTDPILKDLCDRNDERTEVFCDPYKYIPPHEVEQFDRDLDMAIAKEFDPDVKPVDVQFLL